MRGISSIPAKSPPVTSVRGWRRRACGRSSTFLETTGGRDADLGDAAPVGKLAVGHPVVPGDEEGAGEAVRPAGRVAAGPEGHRVPAVLEGEGPRPAHGKPECAEVHDVGRRDRSRKEPARISQCRDVRAVPRPLPRDSAVVQDAVGDPGGVPRRPPHPRPAAPHAERPERVGELEPGAFVEPDRRGGTRRPAARLAVEELQLQRDRAGAGAAGVDERDVRADVRLGPKARDDALGRRLFAGRHAREEDAVGATSRREGGDPGARVKSGHPGRAGHAEPARVRGRSRRSDPDAERAEVGEGFRNDPLLARCERQGRGSARSERRGKRLAVVERERGRASSRGSRGPAPSGRLASRREPAPSRTPPSRRPAAPPGTTRRSSRRR